jgi:hypothetical protein
MFVARIGDSLRLRRTLPRRCSSLQRARWRRRCIVRAHHGGDGGSAALTVAIENCAVTSRVVPTARAAALRASTSRHLKDAERLPDS